ncbi:hypothetical protein CNE_BB1p04150 (plasmid) [Cupriavidus necator N-1]|uniref:Uncharacterized protein n=1 Tax=Cupriavidus necator (strain ATCC 43291 / DSM 13513 / CCUG 52238 / LMG 8453 / N-1) TaxID=1042878 RepID=F8GWW9_CUPNN|nr:hypothetical protein CNE_BB1p04150 [Cupriavidus necator N-1]
MKPIGTRHLSSRVAAYSIETQQPRHVAVELHPAWLIV